MSVLLVSFDGDYVRLYHGIRRVFVCGLFSVSVVFCLGGRVGFVGIA